jgi:excinuclease ABC subunit C
MPHEDQIKSIPNKPGIYKYLDSRGTIIYIGKAKQLKKRVQSYFSNKHRESAKTRILVRNISNIEFIVVDTEQDALLLENNLIKRHKPRYNVLLKDDKTYPWICIKNEAFPRIIKTRTVIKDGSIYFGPYTSGYMLKSLLELIKQLFKVRNCGLLLTEENILNNKYKVCLEFYLGNCNGPCVNKETEIEYNHTIENIIKILKGNLNEVTEYLKKLMTHYSASCEFENAQLIKEKIALIENYQVKSTVVSSSINNCDVFAISDFEKNAYINYFKIVNGAIIQTHAIEIKKKMNESKNELLLLSMVEIRERFNSTSDEIITAFKPDFQILGAKYTIPKIGDKKKLLDLAEKNLKYYIAEKQKNQIISKYKEKKSSVEILQKDLNLINRPEHIECFDISNLQGKNVVASCVVFKKGKPCNQDYRHFNIKSFSGQNDFAAMKEVIIRRYSRLINENKPLPDFIIIDGGKGQLSSALEALSELKLTKNIDIIGIAKKLEEIFKPGESYPLHINKNSYSLRLIQHVRNEAHRFVVNFHRNKRSSGFLKTELELIKGMGEKSIESLYSHFKTLDKIISSEQSEIEKIVGHSKSKIIKNYFSEKYLNL